jgi:hypothetical protein
MERQKEYMDNETLNPETTEAGQTVNQETTEVVEVEKKQEDFGKFKNLEELKKAYEELEKVHYTELNNKFKIQKELEELKNPKKSLTELVKEKLDNNLPIDYSEFKELGYDSDIVDIVKNNLETAKALQENAYKNELLLAEQTLGADRESILEFTNELFNSDSFSEKDREAIDDLQRTNPHLLAKLSTLLYEGYKATPTASISNPYTSRLGSTGDKFNSEKEYQQAMRDPRFANDKNFRNAIIAKANRSFN